MGWDQFDRPGWQDKPLTCKRRKPMESRAKYLTISLMGSEGNAIPAQRSFPQKCKTDGSGLGPHLVRVRIRLGSRTIGTAARTVSQPANGEPCRLSRKTRSFSRFFSWLAEPSDAGLTRSTLKSSALFAFVGSLTNLLAVAI